MHRGEAVSLGCGVPVARTALKHLSHDTPAHPTERATRRT